MERSRAHSTKSPKMERRIIEKNRRKHMKSLYSQLYSLLPSYGSKEILPPVPDQIDEARMYIESLQKKLEMYNEEKEKLLRLQGKKPNSSSNSKNETLNRSKLTNVEIHEMGPNMDIVYITGLEDQASFYGIIRLLCNEGFDIARANFSNKGNSELQISYEKQGGKPTTSRGDSSAVSNRLKELIYGYSKGELVESCDLNLWDFEIEPDMLNLPFLLQTFPAEDLCFLQQM